MVLVFFFICLFVIARPMGECEGKEECAGRISLIHHSEEEVWTVNNKTNKR